MAKKLSLDDLKVQSFVTTLNAAEARQVVGGTAGLTSCCSQGPTSCNTVHTGCCDTQDATCFTGVGDPDPSCQTGEYCTALCTNDCSYDCPSSTQNTNCC